MVPVAAMQNTVRMYHRTVHLLVLLKFFVFFIMHGINIVKFKINKSSVCMYITLNLSAYVTVISG